MKTQSRR